MNHLDLIRDAGADLDPKPVTPPPRMRAEFVQAISEPARRHVIPARRRGRWLVATAVTAAAAIAFAAVVVPAVRPQSVDPGPDDGSARGDAVELDGKQILLAAADRAAAEPFDPPNDDQYVYTRGRIRDSVGPQLQENDYETWIPVDPAREWMTHDQLTIRTGDGTPQEDETTMVFDGCAPEHAEDQGCMPDPGYVADLPATPEAMLDLLQGKGGPWPLENDPVMNAYHLLVSKEIAPDARAVIYRALTLLPKHEVVEGVETLTGRTGTAVAITGPKADLPAEIAEIAGDGRVTIREELVLDPATYELLAYRMVLVGGDTAGDTKPGDVLIEDAIADHGIVDDLRIRPDGTRHEGEIDIDE